MNIVNVFCIHIKSLVALTTIIYKNRRKIFCHNWGFEFIWQKQSSTLFNTDEYWNYSQLFLFCKIQTMAFRSSLSNSSQDAQNSSQESEGSSHGVLSTIYLSVPASTKQIPASTNGFPDHQTSLGVAPEMRVSSQPSRVSSVYQPPPLPPRVGNALGKTNSQSPTKEWPNKDLLCAGISG